MRSQALSFLVLSSFSAGSLSSQTPFQTAQALATWPAIDSAGLRLVVAPAIQATTLEPWVRDILRSQADVSALFHVSPPTLPPVVLVTSRQQMLQLTGVLATGLTDFQTPALLFVDLGPSNLAAIRHELGHWVPAVAWRGAGPAPWVAEGLAMWAQGCYAGHTLRIAAAALARQQQLPALPELLHRFRRLPEVPAYLAAGSVVAYLATQRRDAPQLLWQHDVESVATRLGTSVASIEAGWRAWLVDSAPGAADTASIEPGCSP